MTCRKKVVAGDSVHVNFEATYGLQPHYKVNVEVRGKSGAELLGKSVAW